MACVDLGILTNLVIAHVLTASGGDTIPPRTKPKAMLKPGIIWFVTMATRSAVKKTTKNAKLPIMRHHFFISLKDTPQAASNNKGGRKIKNIKSGSILIMGRPGIKLIVKPATTNKIG